MLDSRIRFGRPHEFRLGTEVCACAKAGIDTSVMSGRRGTHFLLSSGVRAYPVIPAQPRHGEDAAIAFLWLRGYCADTGNGRGQVSP